MDYARRMLGQGRSFFLKKIQITKKGGPVALLHCAAACAARIRAVATALRLNQNYRIAGTVGAMSGLSVSHHHDEPSARLEVWLVELCHYTYR